MDPSLHFSLTPRAIDAYVNANTRPLTANLVTQSTEENLPAVFVKTERYAYLQALKNQFDVKDFQLARNRANPFERIGRSIFINRAAIKLANLDAVYRVTGVDFSTQPQSNQAFTFCDIASGPGAFTQYLQYRFPRAQGYGMTLNFPADHRNASLNWCPKHLDLTRFQIINGANNSGNLYDHWAEFTQTVLSQQPNGVDLVIGDGGFDLESDQVNLLARQEFLSSRLLLTQALIGLACCRVGGHFVCKVFDSVTTITAQLIYLLAQSFERIVLFKPISSRPANAERYLICLGRRQNVEANLALLQTAANRLRQLNSAAETTYLSNLLAEPLPASFVQWLTTQNNWSIERQIQTGHNILACLRKEYVKIPRYDCRQFLKLWHLPTV